MKCLTCSRIYSVVCWNSLSFVSGTWCLEPGALDHERQTVPENYKHLQKTTRRTHWFLIPYAYEISIFTHVFKHFRWLCLKQFLGLITSASRIGTRELGLQHQISDLEDLGFSIKDRRSNIWNQRPGLQASNIGTSK